MLNIACLGVSHQTAPMELLERVALSADQAAKLAALCAQDPAISEVAVLSTCNRLEIYAALEAFHPGVDAMSSQLTYIAGVTQDDAADHLFVRYGQAAISHLFEVACGLDSMSVGETQILGQVRAMLNTGTQTGDIGRVLGRALQRALATAKTVHAETELDQAAPSLLEAALQHVCGAVPSARTGNVVIFGAGGMSALVASRFQCSGAASITVVNRSRERAQQRAVAIGGGWVELADQTGVINALAQADTVVGCTGAMGHVVQAAWVEQARRGETSPVAMIDLGLPRDIDPRVDDIAGVHRVDLEALQTIMAGGAVDRGVAVARMMVAAAVDEYVAQTSASQVGPTLAALAERSDGIVSAEMRRLESKLQHALSETDQQLVADALRRVAAKLMHTPTVATRALLTQADRPEYAQLVRTLFDLDHVNESTVADVQRALPPHSKKAS